MTILRYLLMIVAALIMPGIINKTKARCGGRVGPRLLQPLYDIFKLFRKSEVISESTSFIFAIAPVVTFASILTAGLVVPVCGQRAVISFPCDFVFFAYVLSAGRFFAILGALDTASSFEGMGASREAVYSMFLEPAFFFIIGSFAMYTGFSSFSDMFSILYADTLGASPTLFTILSSAVSAWVTSASLVIIICSSLVLLIMILVESSRMPFDDPNTHLELTMVHEVMVLDNSGTDLAFINIAAAIKMAVFATLITGFYIPDWISPAAALMIYISMMTGIAITIGLIESTTARLRLTHIPQSILGASAIGIIVFLILLAGRTSC